MDGKSRSYMRAVCAVLAAGLLTAGCGKEETAAAETAEIAVPEAAKRAEGSETTASAEFFQSLKIRCLYFQAVQVHGGRSFRSGKTAAFRDDLRMPIWEKSEKRIRREPYMSLCSQAVLDLLSGWMKTAIRWTFWRWNMKIHCKQRKLCCCEFSPFLWLCGRGSGSSDEGEGSGIGSKTRKRMQMRPERSLKEEVCSSWHTV